jgi:hypothetical protein
MNHVFHLPERRVGLRTEPLPECDAALVRAVLGRGPARLEAAGRVRRASAAEIDRLWAGRDTTHAARLEPIDEPVRMLAGEQRTFDVRVENLAETAWPAGERGEPEIRLSYQWLDQQGAIVEYGLRTPLAAELLPGESQVVPVHVLALSRSGRYRLRFDLVHEHVCWFGCAVERVVEVERCLRLALLGHETALGHVLEQLTDEAPEFEPLVLAAGPGPRYGPARAPDLRRYLLEGTGRGPLRDLRLLVARTFMLAGAASKLRAGTPVRPLLRDAQCFLDELGLCSHLLLFAGMPALGTRELWLQAATVEAARRLEVEVVVQEGALARAGGWVDRLLERWIVRRVRMVGPGEISLR